MVLKLRRFEKRESMDFVSKKFLPPFVSSEEDECVADIFSESDEE